MEPLMKASRVVLGAVFLAALGGCAVYPVEPVAYGPPVYAAPPPVVVQPSISFGYSSGYYSYGPRRHWRRRHWH